MKLYLDTSALIKRFTEETGKDQVKSLCEEAEELQSSVLAVAEIVSALQRKVRVGELRDSDVSAILDAWAADRKKITLIPLAPGSEELREVETVGRRQPLKGSDLVHVATAAVQARRAGGVPYRFVTADRRQAAAARAEGLDSVLIGL